MILDIAVKDLKVIFRDKKALAVLLLMPALIILILGSALGSMFNEDMGVERFPVAVVNQDEGRMSEVFVEDFLKKDMEGLLEIKTVDIAAAEKMLRNKEVPAVIVIPTGFTESFFAGKPVEVEIRSSLDDQFKSNIAKSVTDGFMGSTSTLYAGAMAVVETVQAQNLTLGFPAAGGVPNAPMVMGELKSKLNSAFIHFSEESRENNPSITALQYYAASMLVMFMLFGANQGTYLLVQEREIKTLGRIMSASVTKAKLITGKLLGLILVCLLQSFILILFTGMVYGVDWGNSVPGIFLLSLSAVFAASGFGMLIAAIAKTIKSADGMGMIFIQVFTLLGGGMIPAYVFPESLRMVAKITPNWWASKGYHEMMMGAGLTSILPYCAVLAGMGILLLSVGILKFRVE